MRADYSQVLKSFILDVHYGWHIAAAMRIKILRPYSLQLHARAPVKRKSPAEMTTFWTPNSYSVNDD